MISVAEQFSNLRDTLGSILGIFALLRWARTLIAKITGRPPPADATALTPSAFARFQGHPATLPDGSSGPPRPSKKPFLVFILAAFGLPYLMGKMIKALAKSQDEAAQRQQGLLLGPDGTPLPPDQQPKMDISQLDFCRVLYDYPPPGAAQAGTTGVDLVVKKGDPVAVLAKVDPEGNPSEWWQCRARDGRIGYLPSPYLEVMARNPKQLTAQSAPASRTQTMSSVGAQKPGPATSDFSVENFQKGQFYS